MKHPSCQTCGNVGRDLFFDLLRNVRASEKPHKWSNMSSGFVKGKKKERKTRKQERFKGGWFKDSPDRKQH